VRQLSCAICIARTVLILSGLVAWQDRVDAPVVLRAVTPSLRRFLWRRWKSSCGAWPGLMADVWPGGRSLTLEVSGRLPLA